MFSTNLICLFHWSQFCRSFSENVITDIPKYNSRINRYLFVFTLRTLPNNLGRFDFESFQIDIWFIFVLSNLVSIFGCWFHSETVIIAIAVRYLLWSYPVFFHFILHHDYGHFIFQTSANNSFSLQETGIKMQRFANGIIDNSTCLFETTINFERNFFF